jgi:small neutral amino acid transporter SnatA (MarC family)
MSKGGIVLFLIALKMIFPPMLRAAIKRQLLRVTTGQPEHSKQHISICLTS